MKFLYFQQTFAQLPVISVNEMEKAFPDFDRNALTLRFSVIYGAAFHLMLRPR